MGVEKWLIKARWRKVVFGAWAVIKCKNKIAWRISQYTIIQKHIRGYQCRRKHVPRIKAYSRASKLGNQLGKMQQIVSALKENRNEMKAKIDKHSNSVKQHMKDIQTKIMSEVAMQKAYRLLVSSEETLLKELMSKKLQEEEAEKARKIKEEMERARLARIEEEEKKKREEEERERKKKEEEMERKRKAEMEAKRKKEEEEEKKRRRKKTSDIGPREKR